jgi:hypothetical protein
MHVDYSRTYESYFWDCIYGCHETDYESRFEAEQAFLSHTCRSAGEPPC